MPTNQAPFITTGATITLLEDGYHQFSAGDFYFSDANDTPSNNFLNLKILSLPTECGTLYNGSTAVQVDDVIAITTIDVGLLKFVAAPDWTGSCGAFSYAVQDDGGTDDGGEDTSIPSVMPVQITPVNDAPDFTGSDIFVNEDAGAVTIPNWATFNPGGGSDEAAQTALYLVSNPSNPGLFTQAPAVDSAGHLTFTLADNANGTAAFYVQVQDDGGTTNGGVNISSPQMFTITVNAVNDAPSFTANNPPDVDMGVDPVEIANWITSFNPGGGSDESSQTAVSYLVTDISDPSMFSVPPSVAADGTLTYTLAPFAYGNSTFKVQVQDSGGAANGGQDTSFVAVFALQVIQRRTFTVNTTNDTPDANAQANQAYDGFALDVNNDTSLRAAIQEGNNLPAGTIVRINFTAAAAGTINLGTALPNLDGNFRINGLGYNQLTIQRLAGAGDFRIFFVNAGAEVVIRDVTLANGNAVGAGNLGNGGAILNGGSLELYGVVLAYNTAQGYGGAIANAMYATLVVLNCDMNNNVAWAGGAISNNGEAQVAGATMIYANSAEFGGGIHNGAEGHLTVAGGSWIYSNTANAFGGGIYNYGTLEMNSATLDNNWATLQGGGFINFAGTATLTNVSVTNNNANGANAKGGGIYVYLGTTTATSCTITGNLSTAAGFDGGSWRVGFGVLTLTTCTTTGNFTPDP